MALTVGLSAAAALLLLLATPIQLQVAVERERAVEARVRLSWLFGLVRLQLHPSRERAWSPKQPRPARRPGRRTARNARRLAGGLLRPDLRARSVAFLRDLLRALRPRDLRLDARLGLDDPADTGRLWGVLGPLGVLLPRGDVHLEPVFDGACFQFRAAARVRVIPAQLLGLVLAFVLSPAVLRALVAR